MIVEEKLIDRSHTIKRVEQRAQNNAFANNATLNMSPNSSRQLSRKNPSILELWWKLSQLDR